MEKSLNRGYIVRLEHSSGFPCISKMVSGSRHINPVRKSLQTTTLNLMKMAEKFSKRVEYMVGRSEQFLLFSQCFQDLYNERFQL